MKHKPLEIRIRYAVDGDAVGWIERNVIISEGRAIWALKQLLDAGEKGCTAIDNPAPRWSHYIFLLRRYGLNIETVHEKHGGPYAGTHARYVLRSTVDIVEPVEVAA